MRVAKYMIGVSMAIYTTLLVSGMVKHVNDVAWPVHARFHTMQAQFSAAGLGLISLLVLVFAFDRRQSWAWLAIFFSTLAMFTGGFWMSYFVTGDGPPGTRTFVTTALFTFASLLGLFISRRHFFGRRSLRAPDTTTTAATQSQGI
jgi:hypothetical protein